MSLSDADGLQIYMLFLNWRFCKKLELYESMKESGDGKKDTELLWRKPRLTWTYRVLL